MRVIQRFPFHWLRCRGGRYSFLWLALLIHGPYHIMLSFKQTSSTIFWVFGMTQSGIKPRSPGLLAYTLTIIPICIYKQWNIENIVIITFNHLQINQFSAWNNYKEFGLSSLFNGMSTFLGYLMPKPSLYKDSCYTINQYLGVGIFVKCISPKVNIIAEQEFELGYCDVAVQHISHYSTRTSS